MTPVLIPGPAEEAAFITPDEAAPPHAAPEAAETGTQRRCLATGQVMERELLIRFVVDPDNQVVPDLAAKLPGRGLWVSADRAVLELAIRKNLFSRAAKTQVKCSPALLTQVESLLARRCLDLLGLCKSAGRIVAGQAQVEPALRADELAYVLIAADAGGDGPKKLARARQISGFDRETLGKALGRDHIVYIGLKPHPLTDKLAIELRRWQGVRALDDDKTPKSG